MINVLALAYIGDAVYEIYVREYLINKKIYDVKTLQKESIKFVSAKSQRIIVEKLINNNVLTEEEINIFKTGRNAKGGRAKNADIVTYRIATGFETLIGKLYFENKKTRITEIMKIVLGE